MTALQQILFIGLLAFIPMTEAARKAPESSLAETETLKSDDEFNKSSESAELFGNVKKSAGIWWESVEPNMINNEWTQQFEVEEDFNWLWGKKYKFELEQYEGESSGWFKDKSEIDIDRKLPMRIEPHSFTMYGRMSVTIGNKEFDMFKPYAAGVNVFGFYTWRVVPKGDDDNILFTIQKSHKGLLGWGKASWRIFQGRKRDDKVIYYGVGDADDLDEPEFKFYRSKSDYQENKKKWLAKIEHKDEDETLFGNKEDEYKVKVRPGEDAAIILLAVACLDSVADAKQVDEPHDHHD